MDVLSGESYWLVRLLFQRALAVMYLLAFLVAANQFRPLAGEDGLLPLSAYVEQRSFRERPSLFYLVPSDRAIGVAAWSGVALALLALAGGPYWLPEPWPLPASILLWATMWGLYLSFVNGGRLFYGYGWESMLLETGFLAIFLGAGETAPPTLVIWLVVWVLFRNMFGAGLIKLRGDECWRDLTCLDYHYETQPIPNPLSWHAHHLPKRFHRLGALTNPVVELAVPFLYFAPQPFAAVGGLATIGFQLWLMLTGNFAFLNALTIVQAIATLRDDLLVAVLPVSTPAPAATPVPLVAASVLLAVVIAALSIRPVENFLSPAQRMNTAFDPLHIVNTYGAFGSITRHRHQLVIQGTTATDPDEDDWQAYRFKGQPVRTDERPPQIAPYHLRLDWQLWFAAMRPTPGPRQRWLLALLEKLFENDPETLALFAENPFADEGPEQLRVIRYRYAFTDPEERAETGRWWTRERLGAYIPPMDGGGPASRRRPRNRVRR